MSNPDFLLPRTVPGDISHYPGAFADHTDEILAAHLFALGLDKFTRIFSHAQGYPEPLQALASLLFEVRPEYERHSSIFVSELSLRECRNTYYEMHPDDPRHLRMTIEGGDATEWTTLIRGIEQTFVSTVGDAVEVNNDTKYFSDRPLHGLRILDPKKVRFGFMFSTVN